MNEINLFSYMLCLMMVFKISITLFPTFLTVINSLNVKVWLVYIENLTSIIRLIMSVLQMWSKEEQLFFWKYAFNKIFPHPLYPLYCIFKICITSQKCNMIPNIPFKLTKFFFLSNSYIHIYIFQVSINYITEYLQT